MFDWSGVYFKKVLQVADKRLGGRGLHGLHEHDGAGPLRGRLAGPPPGAPARHSAQRPAHGRGAERWRWRCPRCPRRCWAFCWWGSARRRWCRWCTRRRASSTRMSAGMALGGSVQPSASSGFLLGPPVIGFVAGATSLRVSFAAHCLDGAVPCRPWPAGWRLGSEWDMGIVEPAS